MPCGLPLGFAQPLVLLGLLSMPVLWWLLRLIPPQPRRIDFPPTRLLFDITPKEETPRRTPWWLTLLRLTLAALVIIAAAGPAVESAGRDLDRQGAARAADRRRLPGRRHLGRAHAHRRGPDRARGGRQSRRRAHPDVGAEPRHLVRDAGRRARAAQADQAEAARGRARRHAAAARPLPRRDAGRRAGLAHRRRRSRRRQRIRRGARPAHRAARRSPWSRAALPAARALAGADNTAGALTVKVLRVGRRQRREPAPCAALDLKGLPLGEATFAFKAERTRDRRRAHAAGRDPQRHRAARDRRRALGRRGGAARQALAAALRSASSPARPPTPRSRSWPPPIICRARSGRSPTCGSPSAARPRRRSSQFIEQRLPMMILADVGNVAEAREQLTRWIEDGGVLVRFAGPRLAAGDDDLVPVKLRRGGRVLGGALSWDQPQQLAAFSRESPFFGMAVPTDVTVSRQVLAEPDATLDRAHLGDARRRHPAGHRAAPRQGHDRAVPRHRRYALVRPAAVGRIRRNAQANRLACRLDRDAPMPMPPAARRRARSGAADAAFSTASACSARRRRPRGRCRPASPGAPRRSSARLLWTAGRLAGGERAGARRPACAARCLGAQCAPGGLSDERAARICAGPILLAALALLALDALVVFLLAGGIAAADAPAAAGGGRACDRDLRRRAAARRRAWRWRNRAPRSAGAERRAGA